MMYPDLTFPKVKGRPFFYSNFVQTVDGKVQVTKSPETYWPIGSKTDHQTLVELRAFSDVLIHGKKTALWPQTLEGLAKPEFQRLRDRLGKKKPVLYIVISNHPDGSLIKPLVNPKRNTIPLLVTPESAVIPKELDQVVEVLRAGKNEVDLNLLAEFLHKNDHQNILVEGGPTLLGSFFVAGLIDEVFVTIAPKIFGNQDGATLTMIEGSLLSPDKVKPLRLLSVKTVKDEIYLRYRVKRSKNDSKSN